MTYRGESCKIATQHKNLTPTKCRCLCLNGMSHVVGKILGLLLVKKNPHVLNHKNLDPK